MQNNLFAKNSTYIFIACALHVLIVLLMCMRFSWLNPIALPGKQQLEIVGAYLASETQPVVNGDVFPAHSEEARSAVSKHKEKIFLKDKQIVHPSRRVRFVRVEEQHKVLRLETQRTLPRTNVKTSASTQAEQISGNNQPLPELLTLLHTAIQNTQRYPDSALEMQREGRTTLKFRLKTNGQIEHLQIVKSSGTLALDQAALDAVNDATPFPQVDKLIHHAQEYQIDVVFKLS